MVVGSWQEGGVGAPRSPAVARQRVDSGFSNVAFFSCKNIHSPFWILASRGQKRAKKPRSPHQPHEKFGILNGTKHTHKIFDILHFIIPK
jgi:hypothetical protein